jgi:tyrosyl-tRNA synthetase
VKNGGVYVNNVKVEDAADSVALSDAIDGKFVVLRRGKKSYHLVRLIA